MIEYIAKFYNNKSNNCLFEENIKKFNLKKLYDSEVDIDLVIIEKRTTIQTEDNKNEVKTQKAQSLAIYDKTKWNLRRIQYMPTSIKLFENNEVKIPVEQKCRTKKSINKEELLKKLEKIQNTFYFMEENPPSYEEFYRKRHHL